MSAVPLILLANFNYSKYLYSPQNPLEPGLFVHPLSLHISSSQFLSSLKETVKLPLHLFIYLFLKRGSKI